MGFLINPITKGSISPPIQPKQPGFVHCSFVSVGIPYIRRYICYINLHYTP